MRRGHKKFVRTSYCLAYLMASSLSLFSQHVKPLAVGVEKLIENVQLYPESASVHAAYQKAFRDIDSTIVITQYEKWRRKFPMSVGIHLAAGKYLTRLSSSKARQFLQRATILNPELAEAWYLLSLDAERWGDNTYRVHAIAQAVRADPNNPEYRLHQLNVLFRAGQKDVDSLGLEIDLKFNGTEAGAKALLFLAEHARGPDLKEIYYRLLLERYCQTDLIAFRNGMTGYFTSLIKWTRYADAAELALRMIYFAKRNKLEWKHKFKVATQFVTASNLIASGRFNESLEILNSIELKSGFSASYVWTFKELLLLRAHVYNLNNETVQSYKLLSSEYEINPGYQLRDSLLKYGVKLGKDTAEIMQAIRRSRRKSIVKATPFKLLDYRGNLVSLEDYKGKIVLITFWFPSCGPCRSEFPFFEAALAKFSKDEIAYLGININHMEDGYVLPFIRNTGYTFLPLKVSNSWDKGNLQNNGSAPVNFLIDQFGNILWKNFQAHNRDQQEAVELMIEESLNN